MRQLSFVCPAPRCTNVLTTTDPNHARHVALGQVVCSEECHAAMYDLTQYELPLHFHAEPTLHFVHNVGPP